MSRWSTSSGWARSAASSSSKVAIGAVGSGSSPFGSQTAGRENIASGCESRPRVRWRSSRRHGVAGRSASASISPIASVSSGLTTTWTPSALASVSSTSVFCPTAGIARIVSRPAGRSEGIPLFANRLAARCGRS